MNTDLYDELDAKVSFTENIRLLKQAVNLLDEVKDNPVNRDRLVNVLCTSVGILVTINDVLAFYGHREKKV